MAIEFGPKIADEGLVFAFDSASGFSYGGSGDVIRGLSSGVDASLVNGADYQASTLTVEKNGGFMALPGS